MLQFSKQYQSSIHYSLAALLCLPFLGCRSRVSVSDISPSSTLQASQVSEDFFIPHDPNLPIQYFTVEKVSIKHSTGAPVASELTTDIGRTLGAQLFRQELMNHSFAERQHQIAAQLGSSILGVQNFRLIDYQSAKERAFTYRKRGDVPSTILVVRAELTEYEERVTESGSTIRLPFIYRGSEASKTGTIALDISVVDLTPHGKNMYAFPVQASFRNVQSQSDPTLGAVLFKNTLKMQSSIDQALRVATIEVAKELFKRLKKEKS